MWGKQAGGGIDMMRTKNREESFGTNDMTCCPFFLSKERALHICSNFVTFFLPIRGTFIGGGGRVHQKHNLFRARSAQIVGMYVCTSSLTSLTLANLLAERPMSGIAFYVGIRRTPP